MDACPLHLLMICRLENPDDESFIRKLMIETLAGQLDACSWHDEIRESLLDAQYRIRRAGFRASAGNQPGTIVLIDGEPVAWYIAADFDDEIRLVNLVVANQHRGKGLGSAILRQLLIHSDHSGKTLRLSVAINNPRAAELYARFGFRRTGDDGVHHFMERPAQ
jgi:ribosomal protein S18 acetylase RimI-like enzyme